ncbi:MAG: hypothetical protein LBK99_19755 [Opitutaceae bacterium]|nr:hypothetical protein [Opitutaceae bacterium]
MLKVDFDSVTNPSPVTEPGFISWAIDSRQTIVGVQTKTFPVASPAVSAKSITVTLGGGRSMLNPTIANTGPFTLRDRAYDFSRFRFGRGFMHGALYRDVLFVSNGGGKVATTLLVRFSGLQPGANYAVTFYSMDALANSTTRIVQVLETGSKIFGADITCIANTAAGYDAGTPLLVAGTRDVATADKNGDLLFSLTTAGDSNQAALNGFELGTVMKETEQRCAGIEERAKELAREFTEVNDRVSDAGLLFKTKQICSGCFITVP